MTKTDLLRSLLRRRIQILNDGIIECMDDTKTYLHIELKQLEEILADMEESPLTAVELLDDSSRLTFNVCATGPFRMCSRYIVIKGE